MMALYTSIDVVMPAGADETAVVDLGDSRVVAVELIGDWPNTFTDGGGVPQSVCMVFLGAIQPGPLREQWTRFNGLYEIVTGPDRNIAVATGVLLNARFLALRLNVILVSSLTARLVLVEM